MLFKKILIWSSEALLFGGAEHLYAILKEGIIGNIQSKQEKMLFKEKVYAQRMDDGCMTKS